MSQGRWDREAIRNFSADDILDSLGLARKSQQTSWFWPAIGGVTLGLCAGVAIGMAFAPRSGRSLREEIGGKLKSRDYSGLADSARQVISETRDQVRT